MLGRRGRPPYPGPITPAEQRVLEHIRQGLTNPEIAVRLGISVNTVRFHVSNLLTKANLSSRDQLAAWDPPPGTPPRRWLALPVAKLALGVGAAVIVFGVVAAAITSDGSSPAASEMTPPAPTPTPDPEAPVLPRFSPDIDLYYNALGTGGILVRVGRCLYADTIFDGAPRRYLLVFAPDSGYWDSEADALIVGGLPYEMGSEAGGLPGNPSHLPMGGTAGIAPAGSEYWLVAPDASCAADMATFVLVPDPPSPDRTPPSPPWLPRYSLEGTYWVTAETGHRSASVEAEGRCIYLVPNGADERWLVAFPRYGSWWDDASGALLVFDARYPVGGNVELAEVGSGFMERADDERLWEVQPDPACDASKVFALDPWAPMRAAGRDAQQYASSANISPAEAARRIYLMPRLEVVMQALIDAAPERVNSVCYDQSGEFGILATYTGDGAGLEPVHAVAEGSPAEVVIRTGATNTAQEMIHILNDAFLLSPAEARAEFRIVCDYIVGVIPPSSAYVGREHELAELLTNAYGVTFIIEPPPH